MNFDHPHKKEEIDINTAIKNKQISETVRYSLSRDTVSYLKQARENLKELQKEIPSIKGFTFFGSRMIGNDTKDSDLDCAILFDADSFALDCSSSKIKFPLKYCTRNGYNDVDFAETFKSLMGEINEKNSIKIPYHIAAVIDMSETGISSAVSELEMYLKIFEKNDKKEISKLINTLVYPFYFGIGDGVYEIRNTILEKIGRKENGEFIWSKLSEMISYLERDIETEKRKPLNKYSNYPKTIEEAKRFFILKNKEELYNSDYYK